MKTYIPTFKVNQLQKDFQKIIRKAVKLELPVPELIIHENDTKTKYIVQEDYNNIVKRHIHYTNVEIVGKLPVFEGWNLVACVEHARTEKGEENFNTVRISPEFEEKQEQFLYIRTASSTCDHCNHNRYRKNTYLLFNTVTGEYKRVGSSCIKDFLGNENPDNILNSAAFVDLLSQFEENIEREYNSNITYFEYDLEEVLSVTSAAIRLHGWTSRGDAQYDESKEATANLVLPAIVKSVEYLNDIERNIIESVNDYDKKLAKDAIEWIKTFDISDPSLNNYIYNCCVLTSRQSISEKDFGVACSIVSSYKNKLAKEIEKKNQKPSNYVGEVKERLRNLKLTFQNEWRYETQWGVSCTIKFVDDDGNVFIWKTSNIETFECGDVVILDGTVKEHKEFRDVKQTIITRCKIKEVIYDEK